MATVVAVGGEDATMQVQDDEVEDVVGRRGKPQIKVQLE